MVGSRMAGQRFMVSSSNGELETEKVMEYEAAADIGGMPDIMDRIMERSGS